MKPKVAIVRGPGLSKWEMRIYEPLTEWFALTAIGSTIPVNDIQNIQFPIKKLVCTAQYFASMPKLISMMYTLFGDTQWLNGFDKAVVGSDIVHSVELFNGYSVQAVRAKKKGLVKAVTLTIHENIPFLYDNYAAKMSLKQEVIEGTDRFLAINKMSKQMLLLEGVDEKRISVIPQSVDTHTFRPPTVADKADLKKLRKKYNLSDDDFVVLAVGRMVWEKGWYDLIPAALQVAQKIKNVKFLFIGSGPERKYLETFSKRHGLHDVITFMTLPYSQMDSMFRIADLFVYPSLPTSKWNAQFGGGVLTEAMSSALPIVATLNGGVIDLVGAEGGIFLQPQRFADLADAIIKFAHDPKLRHKTGMRNRKTALSLYGPLVVAKQIKNQWDMILERRNNN
jgi:glycosyltransferase involved in cell wall biosynthesis